MLKLYRLSSSLKEYWETWEIEAGAHVVHWGELGTRGSSKTVKPGLFQKASSVIQKEVDDLLRQGFSPAPQESHTALMIEFAVEGMGSEADLEKRHRLEERMDQTLGWTGLGACDGGSIGSDTMEICSFVVDFETAKRVVEQDLADTEFADYARIYAEDRD